VHANHASGVDVPTSAIGPGGYGRDGSAAEL
jgi:hypothetical protein